MLDDGRFPVCFVEFSKISKGKVFLNDWIILYSSIPFAKHLSHPLLIKSYCKKTSSAKGNWFSLSL